MSNLLYGMHDREGRAIPPAGGWCLDTVKLAEKPTGTDYAALRPDINWIGRLNWGYGTTGTIPRPDKYQEMASAAAAYVAGSRGCNLWIIGNEPNHENERPDHVYITPHDYARCFTICRNAIKNVNVNNQVVVAACAPYHANPTNWLYYYEEMLHHIEAMGGADGLSVHAYTRSSKPEDIYSEATMGPPLEGQFSGFYCFIDALETVPASMLNLPAYLTEFNELLDHGWDNANTGVVQAAYEAIHDWNEANKPAIHCLVLYRFPNYDKWYIDGKTGVLDDFWIAAEKGYPSPTNKPQPMPPLPPLPNPIPPASDMQLIWPVDTKYPVTQWFASTQIDYSKYGGRAHNGIDIGTPLGTEVKSVADGEVMMVGTDPAYGHYIRIHHAKHNFHSMYCHLSSQRPNIGSQVLRGQPIGLSGDTGNVTGPHLHLMFRAGSKNHYYDLHDGYDKGAFNPLIAYSLYNKEDPNTMLRK